MPTPNAICKNKNCRSPFLSCIACAKIGSYRAICCSIKCYDEYAKQIEESRKNKKVIKKEDLLPERIDIPQYNIKRMIKKPIEELIEVAKEELGEYGYLVDTIGLGAAVDEANKNIANQEPVRKPRKSRKEKSRTIVK